MYYLNEIQSPIKAFHHPLKDSIRNKKHHTRQGQNKSKTETSGIKQRPAYSAAVYEMPSKPFFLVD